MELKRLSPIDVRESLEQLESQAITLSKRRNDLIVRAAAGAAAGAGTFTAGMMLLVMLMKTLVLWPIWLGFPIFFLGLLGVVLASFAAAGRYLSPSERRLLPAILEPDAEDFLSDNWGRRDRLLAEADAYNDALQAFKALPERAGADEIDEGVYANLAARRARIEAEAERYFAEFRAATEEERTRVAAANVRRKRLPSPHRQSLRAFRQKVKKLARLERSLEALSGSFDGDPDVDLAPYQAALRFREELEKERETLLRCGLKPKKLPAAQTGRKALPKPR